LLTVLLALRASSALAHAGLPETSNVALRRGHPEDFFVGTTFGSLVSRDSGRSWRWICIEAMGSAGWTPSAFLWQADGTLLGTTGQALLRSRDGGCSWQAHPSFTGLWPTSLASHPSQESRLWVSTGKPNALNTLYRSDDGGETFSPTPLKRTGTTFSAVKVAPSSPQRLYVSASTSAGLSLFRSDDGGDTWEELPQPLPELNQPFDLLLLRVAEGNADLLWARVSAQGYTYLLESRDAGRTLRPVLTLDEPLVGAEASADGRTLWAATPTRLYRSRDGAPATPLTLPDGNACAHREGSTLYVCGSSWVHDWALARSSDEGDTWEPLFGLPDVQGPLECPAGTPTHDTCPARWPQMAQLIGAPYTPPPDAGTPPPEEPKPPASKGCSATAGAELAAACLLTSAVLRRSRRRATHPRGPSP
jgi:photosystem II stability/assembly factor-like uncharacterized protein